MRIIISPAKKMNEERDITDPESIKAYDGLHFRFCPERSSDTEYVFLKEE